MSGLYLSAFSASFGVLPPPDQSAVPEGVRPAARICHIRTRRRVSQKSNPSFNASRRRTSPGRFEWAPDRAQPATLLPLLFIALVMFWAWTAAEHLQCTVKGRDGPITGKWWTFLFIHIVDLVTNPLSADG